MQLVLEDSIAEKEDLYKAKDEGRKKRLVVLYDGGDHSDMVLKTASWLEASRKFKITVLSIKKKEGKHLSYSRINSGDIRHKKNKEKEKHVEYLEQVGVEFRDNCIREHLEQQPKILSGYFFFN